MATLRVEIGAGVGVVVEPDAVRFVPTGDKGLLNAAVRVANERYSDNDWEDLKEAIDDLIEEIKRAGAADRLNARARG